MAEVPEGLSRELSDRYRIEREIGRGGMAIVYGAEDVARHRTVALKVMRPEIASGGETARFLQEIEMMQGFTHPFIIPILDSGAVAGVPFYVMPLIEGESLRDRLQRAGPLPLGEAVRIGREIAEALDYAHQRGIVHRDLKPENVLLSGGHAVVSDFGIARAIGQAAGDRLTSTGVVLGTPAYMGPEQGAGGATDGRTDIYSLGCLLYEALAGQPPYSGPTIESLMRQHAAGPIPDVTLLRPSVPMSLRTTIERAMAKTPADRFANAAEMATRLRSAEAALEVGGSGDAVGAGLRGGATDAAAMPVSEGGGEVSFEAVTVGVKRAGSIHAADTASGRRYVRPALLVAAFAIIVLAFAWPSSPLRSILPGGDRSAAAGEALPWIWIADFDGPEDDPGLTAAAQSLVGGVLDQQGVVATVPRQQVVEALRLSSLPETTLVDAVLARELAYRSAVPFVLAGDMRRIGSEFSIVLRVSDTERDSMIATTQGNARDEDDLIPTLSRMGRDISKAILVREPVLKRYRPNYSAATPSFAAFRYWTEAFELVSRGDPESARDRARAALELDPGFVDAWASLSAAYFNLGLSDSARWADRQALQHPERMDEFNRLLFETRTSSAGNEARLLVSDRLLRLKPTAGGIWNGRGLVLHALGRLEEAYESYRRAEACFPVAVPQALLWNELETLLRMGRVDEAETKLLSRFTGEYRELSLASCAKSRGNWAKVDSLIRRVRADPDASSMNRHDTFLPLAAALAARGAISEAERELDRSVAIARTSNNPAWAEGTYRVRLVLALALSPESRRPLLDELERAAADTATIGLCAAGRGDTLRARRILTALRANGGVVDEERAIASRLIEAWIALDGAQWDRVTTLVRASALPHNYGEFFGQVPLARWLAARAHDAGGQADSAAVAYERLVSSEGLWPDQWSCVALGSVFARQRLVMLYTQLGRLDDARRHMDYLTATVTRPDPKVRQLLDEARAALEAAEAMQQRPRT